MANPFIGVRIPSELNEALVARMQETGQSKSEVVIAALRNYLGIPSCHERLDAIEQRLSVLESVAGQNSAGADASVCLGQEPSLGQAQPEYVGHNQNQNHQA